MAVYNANYVGGDIIGGASSPTQLLFQGPDFPIDPYFTGIPGTYLCSASTPPGAGAHGMCGANAAEPHVVTTVTDICVVREGCWLRWQQLRTGSPGSRSQAPRNGA